VSKPSVSRNLLESLLAVLLGNLVYFLLMPYLPERVRHVPTHPDLGLFVDFAICLMVLGLVRAVGKRIAR
jgi:capsular polysaccharide biosynthesis protein